MAVTSEGRGELAALAAKEGYRTFPVPENVGGRFNVLSAVGLVPAALINLDIRRLQKRGSHDPPFVGGGHRREYGVARRPAQYLVWQLRSRPSRWRSPTPTGCGARRSGSVSSGPSLWGRLTSRR